MSIELDSEVESIKDLWVDYSPSREVSLKVALGEILDFIKTKHGVPLRWREIDGRIIIERQSEGFRALGSGKEAGSAPQLVERPG